MDYPIKRIAYTRNGETRKVCGVRRAGQGQGSMTDTEGRTGKIWWRVDGKGAERSCTVAKFCDWLGIPTPPYKATIDGWDDYYN